MLFTDVKKKYKTAIYMRLSKEDGDKVESDSIANQRKTIEKFLEEHTEFELYDEYVDDGYTGLLYDRPDFLRMLNDIDNKQVDCIIVKDASRFGRDYIENGLYVEHKFERENIRFIAILDSYDSLTSDETTRNLVFPMRNIMNAFYSRDISRKVKNSFDIKRRKGDFIGAYACYGYKKKDDDKHKLVVDDYAAIVVCQIFDMYLSGKNLTQIANWLNSHEVLSPSQYKKVSGSTYKCGNQILKESDWTRSVISEMLRNQTYIGNLVQGKTSQTMRRNKKRVPKKDWIIIENTHQPIVDKETFAKVQSMLSRNIRHEKKLANGTTAIFSGFLRCGDCGMALSQRIQKGKYISYSCSNYTRHGHTSCSPHHITQKKLTEIVLNDLNSIIASVKDLERIVEEEKKGLSKPKRKYKIANLLNDRERIEKRKKKAYEDYQDGELTKEEYHDYKMQYNEEIDFLTQKINAFNEEEQRISSFTNAPWITNLLEMKKVESLDKNIIYQMIDNIFVYEDKTIVIKYRFSEEFERLQELYGE